MIHNCCCCHYCCCCCWVLALLYCVLICGLQAFVCPINLAYIMTASALSLCVCVCESCLTIWQVICVLGKNVVQYHNEIQYKYGIIKFNQNWYSITLPCLNPSARSAAEMVEKFNLVAVAVSYDKFVLCFRHERSSTIAAICGKWSPQKLVQFVTQQNFKRVKVLPGGSRLREGGKKCLSWVRCHLAYCQFTLYIRVSFGPFATQEATQCPKGREVEKSRGEAEKC